MTGANGDAPAAYENPLIPTARLRQIYLAMVRVRMLERALPGVRRGRAVAAGAAGAGAQAAGIVGLEACLVSTSVDLEPGDLVSDALTGGVVDFLRGARLGVVLGTGKVGRGSGVVSGCGAASRLAGVAGVAERMWIAMGAAAALKSAAARVKVEGKGEGVSVAPAGVAVVYVRQGEATPAVWRKALRFAAEQDLPIVFVVLPAGRRGVAGVGITALARVSALSLRCGVPGIAVDSDDAVAIYRVSQESIGRARAGGGAALIECVAFVLDGVAGRRRPVEDAIAAMERYMVERGIATEAWREREARSFGRRLVGGRSAD